MIRKTKKRATKRRATKKRAVKKESCCISAAKCKVEDHGCGGFGYFMGFIGAAVYYISTATGFWNGVWGVIKALVWPAFLVYGLLKNLGL